MSCDGSCEFIEFHLYVSGFVINRYGYNHHKLMYFLSLSVKYVYFSRCGSLDNRTIFRTVILQTLDSRKINTQAEKHF